MFCSTLCPFGAVQDIISRFTPRRWQHKLSQSLHEKAFDLKYLVLALLVGAALIADNVTLFQYFEPSGTLFFLQGTLILWLILFAILAACVVVPRFYRLNLVCWLNYPSCETVAYSMRTHCIKA